MARHFHKYVKHRKIAGYSIVNVYFHHFIRLYFCKQQRDNSVIGTNEIMTIHKNCYMFIFRTEFRIHSYDMYGALRKTFIGVLDDISGFMKVEWRNQM